MSDREKSCCNGELVCVRCAARTIGITSDMVRAWARSGVLPGARRLGGRIWAFSSEAVQQALVRHEEHAKQGGLGLVVSKPAQRVPLFLPVSQRTLRAA